MSANWEQRWYEPQGARWNDLPLRAASWLYGLGVAARARAYDTRFWEVTRVEGARIVSVGNLHVGGMGKTPVVIFLAKWAQRCGHQVAVLSRGYGRHDDAPRSFDAAHLPSWETVGDEPRLIAQRCPTVKVLVGADRAALAEKATREHKCDFLILDDGFQHRALARDVDLVVWDSDVGAGNGALLPAGPLREPLTALGRAHVLWTKGLGSRLPAHFKGTCVRAEHVAQAVLSPNGTALPLDSLRGQHVVALAGLARPKGFQASLEAAGAQVAQTFFFPDHHPFTPTDLSRAVEAAREKQAWLITTEKDAQRLPVGMPAHQLRLSVRVNEGLPALARALGLVETLAPV